MNIIDKYIDYKILSNSKYFGIDRKKSAKKGTGEYYVDRDIFKVDRKRRRDDFSIFQNIKKSRFVMYSDRIMKFYHTSKSKYGEYKEIKEKSYISTSNKIIVFCSEICDVKSYNSVLILGAIDIKSKKIIYLGDDNCHPFLITSEISYFNSDGSGPSFPSYKDCSDVKTITKYLRKYFNEFSSDVYH